jgi:putative ABC transport system permease protein
MNAVTRGIRNAFRNVIRTSSLVLILGLSIGLALAMMAARASVQNKIETVKTTIGNTIEIMPAGAQGFMGGGEPLKTEKLDDLSKLANVKLVKQTLSDRLTTENSNLQSAIEPGTLGRRGAANSGVQFRAEGGGGSRMDSNSDQPIVRTFTPPVLVTAANDISDPTIYGGDNVSFTSGAAFDLGSDENIAVVGKALAEKNSLSVGSTFTAYGKEVKVVGIYDAGNVFANAGMLMPLKTLQRLSGQTGNVTNAVVTVSSIDNVDSVLAAVKAALGDTADVTSNKASATAAVTPLESVKKISTFSLLGAVAAGAVIILLTMVMIVRERRREIGVFKAIGGTNTKIMTQFASEAVTLTLLGLIAGVLIGVASAAPLTRILVNNSASNTDANISTTSSAPQFDRAGPSSTAGGRETRIGGPGARLRTFGNDTVTNVRNVKASVGLGTLAYGVVAAFVIAILGSIVPALMISKIRPAEIMRAE